MRNELMIAVIMMTIMSYIASATSIPMIYYNFDNSSVLGYNQLDQMSHYNATFTAYVQTGKTGYYNQSYETHSAVSSARMWTSIPVTYYSGNTDFSVSFRMKTNESRTSTYQGLLSTLDDSNNGYDIQIGGNAYDGKIALFDGGNFHDSTFSMSTHINEWTTVGITQKSYGSNNVNITLYVNGSKILNYGTTRVSSGLNMTLFSQRATAASYPSLQLNGSIDEFYFFNYTLDDFTMKLLHSGIYPMNISIIYPANDSHENSPFDVIVLVNGSYPSYSCNLTFPYDADAEPPIYFIAVNNTNTSIEITESDDIETFNVTVSCANDTYSGSSPYYTYTVDSLYPTLTLLSPSENNDSIFDENVNLTGWVYDAFLLRFRGTIYDSMGNMMYQDYKPALMDTTYNFTNQTINSSLWTDGIYSLFIEASDSHTSNDWASKEDITIDRPDDKRMTISLDKADIDVNAGMDDISPVIKSDRISFDISSDGKIGKKTLAFHSTQPFMKVPMTTYKCHYVFSDYWIDGEGLPGVECHLTTQYDLIMDYYLTDSDSVFMNSLGGLNIIEENFTFNIASCVPDWVCNGYDICFANDTKICNSVIDNNSCGITYSGDYSEFSPIACDYCELEFSTSETACVNDMWNVTFTNTNFAVCCNITMLDSDCLYDGHNMLDTGGVYIYEDSCVSPPEDTGTATLYILFAIYVFMMIVGMLLIGFVLISGAGHIFMLFASMIFIIINNGLIGYLGLPSYGEMMIRILFTLIGIVTLFIYIRLLDTPDRYE